MANPCIPQLSAARGSPLGANVCILWPFGCGGRGEGGAPRDQPLHSLRLRGAEGFNKALRKVTKAPEVLNKVSRDLNKVP